MEPTQDCELCTRKHLYLYVYGLITTGQRKSMCVVCHHYFGRGLDGGNGIMYEFKNGKYERIAPSE